VTPGRISTRKQVVVRKLDKGLIKGFVDLATYLMPEGLEVLDREGRLVQIPLNEVKGVFFVRDFEGNAQRPERKVFHSRPRLAGLWVRMTFKDNEILEGLTPNNLLHMDPRGFFVTPLDLYSNNVNIFIPRSALATLEVIGVVKDGGLRRGSQRPAQPRPGSSETERQMGLFASTSPDAKK
jgi:uncharacterized protein DUF6982